MKDKWLIAIDLDRTFLKDNNDYPNFEFNLDDSKVLNKLTALGHKIIFVTGRSWVTTKFFYEKFNSKFLIVNYNGGLINHPKDDKFPRLISTIPRKDINKILKVIQLNYDYQNVIFEFEDHIEMLKKDPLYISEYNLAKYSKIKKLKLKKERKMNPLAVYVKTENKLVNNEELLKILNKTFENEYTFWYWTKKINGLSNLELNRFGISKASGVKYVADYYGISMDKTIAFGDNWNDIEMLKAVKHGVAIKNAKEVVKQIADDVTKYTNNESGVVKYLVDFFKL